MQKKDCYYLGKVTKKHGFKGNLILHFDTDEPGFYNNLESVLIETNGILVPFFFESYQLYAYQKFLVKFEGISAEEAENLVNRELYLPLNALPPLTGTKFYYHEIIGFSITDKNYGKIGVIKSVNTHSAQDLFEIDVQGKQILIPIVDEWIVEVSREKKQIILVTPEGLIDLF